MTMMACNNVECPVTVFNTVGTTCPGCRRSATPSPPVLVAVETADLLADLRATQRQDDQASAYSDGQQAEEVVKAGLTAAANAVERVSEQFGEEWPDLWDDVSGPEEAAALTRTWLVEKAEELRKLAES